MSENKERSNTGLEVLKVAAVLGVLGDVLLRQIPWGLNVLLFNLAFVAGLVFLLKRNAREKLNFQTYGLLGAQLFFASMFVWRDSSELRVANAVTIVVILGVLFVPTLKIAPRVAGAFQYGIALIWAGVNSVFGAAGLLGADIDWNEISKSGGRRRAFAVIRGAVLALPLLLIFGALFMSADGTYEGWIKRVFYIDFTDVISHLMLFGIFSWLSAGYLRGSIKRSGVAPVASAIATPVTSRVENLRADSGEHPVVLPENRTVIEHLNASDDAPPADEKPAHDIFAPDADQKKKWSWADIDNSFVPGFTLGGLELGVVLGLLNLLFLSFVIFQLPYLFGGMHLIQNTPDLKLAEYARRGFGEIVAVAALVLPILLATHWLLKNENLGVQKLFRVLAGIQIGLLFVIMASAVQRLVLLTGSEGYGLTTARLYPLIFMSWLAIVFVVFCATVLRNARRHFAWAALWSAFFVLAATHFLNPDALIVRTNLALMQQGRQFDSNYNAGLSDDAIPYLLSALPEMSTADRCKVSFDLERRQNRLAKVSDPRSFNWSQHNAHLLLGQDLELVTNNPECPNPLRIADE